MSYLSTPRLIFAGNFIADPSTVNNDPEHFDDSTFQPNYQQPGAGATNGWWNPKGTGNWKFAGCTVQQVFYTDGTSTTDPNVDPIIGATFDSNANTPAKLVDLDPEQQMVSQIWGLQLTLGQPPNRPGFTSDFAVAPFADIWFRVPPPKGQPDSCFGAFYQSVLTNIGQFSASSSRFLQELSATFGASPQLSIKFNVDGFDDDSTSPTFTQGRVVGAIGAYVQGEPQTFIAKRALQGVPPPPPTPPPPMYTTVYAQIDGNVLTLDLGNALTTESPGGALLNAGALYAVLMVSDGVAVPTAVPVVNNSWQDSAINYLEADWYPTTAGIVSFTLDPTTLALAAETPLAIVAAQESMTTLFQEATNGMWLRADEFVFRLNPGDTASATLYATRFGQPAAGQPIALAYDPSYMVGQTTQGMIPGPQVVGEPTSALTFPTSLTTGADGTAALPMQAADPGSPRSYIDGQLYGVTYALGNTPPPFGSVANPSWSLSVLVWSGYTAPAQPTWTDDVQPILQQYANLYPYMMKFVNLADYTSVIKNLSHIQRVMSLPVTDPAYMPVVRDLSQAKVNMLLNWFNNPIESAGAAAKKH